MPEAAAQGARLLGEMLWGVAFPPTPHEGAVLMWAWGAGARSVPWPAWSSHVFMGSSLGHPLIRDLPAASAQYMETPPRPRSPDSTFIHPPPVPTAVTSTFMWRHLCCLFQEASLACPGGLAALSRQHSLSENGLPRWGQSGRVPAPGALWGPCPPLSPPALQVRPSGWLQRSGPGRSSPHLRALP